MTSQQTRSPYDTGVRAEPKVWKAEHRESDEDFGKVDFDTDTDYTVATVWVERSSDGYTLKGHHNEPLTIDLDDQSGAEGQSPTTAQPSVELRHRVQQILDNLHTPHEGEGAEVFWNPPRTAIIVLGEMFIRKP